MSSEEKVEVVRSDDNIAVAIGKLKESGQKALIVVEGDNSNYVGILTERAVSRTLADPSKTKVKSLLQKVPAVSQGEKISRIARLMVQYDTRVIPVVENSKVKGIVTSDMVLSQVMNSEYSKVKLKDIMTPAWSVVTIGEDESIGKAISLMRRHAITRLPVVRGTKITGIVTAHDTLFKIIRPRERMSKGELKGEKSKFLGEKVSSIMSSPVISLKPDSTVKDAYDLMKNKDISSVIILNDFGELQGIVTIQDLLKHIIEEKEEGEDVRVQIAAKLPHGEDVVRLNNIQQAVDNFVRKYRALLKGSSMSVYVKAGRMKKKGRRLTHVRIVISSPAGNYVTSEEGWGDAQAINRALSTLERQLLKKKEAERKRTESHKNIYEMFELLY